MRRVIVLLFIFVLSISFGFAADPVCGGNMFPGSCASVGIPSSGGACSDTCGIRNYCDDFVGQGHKLCTGSDVTCTNNCCSPSDGSFGTWVGVSPLDGNYEKETRTYTPANSCGDNIQGPIVQCKYFVDNDEDGFGTVLSDTWRSTNDRSVSSCPEPTPTESKLGGDCDDSNAAVNPGASENTFSLCTDSLDNNCNLAVDQADSSCQHDCSVDYDLLFRYDSTSGSVTTTSEFDYSYYYPLCANISSEVVSGTCSDGFNAVLYKNDSGQVASTAYQGSYDDSICLQNAFCYVDSSCSSPFTATASLWANDSMTTAGHPSASSPYKLCCSVEEKGVTFDNGASYEELLCSPFSDGICPEDFENSAGQQISCSDTFDPDCGGSSPFFEATTSRFEFFVNFTDKNYVLGTDNSDDALLTVSNESNVDNGISNEYIYEFAITSDIDSSYSRSVLNFSYAQSPPEILFDGSLLSSCASNPADLGEVPCYIWDENAFSLEVYHTLSDHTLTVAFPYKELSVLMVLLFLFAALLPLGFVHYSKAHHLGIVAGFKKHTSKAIKDDILRAEEYISERLKLGHSKDAIRKDLHSAGWKHHIIELALHGVHNSKDKQKLRGYISACLDLGVTKSELYAVLLSADWDRGDIDEIIKDYYR
jgi:hypothetical protein